MIFRVYGLEANSYVDGPGVRLAIFFSGVSAPLQGLSESRLLANVWR